MSLDRRLAALTAAVEARDQNAQLTAEQMDAAVAELVAFMGSSRFGLEVDAIREPTGPHSGDGCPRCRDNYRQEVTVGLVTAIEHSNKGTTQLEPITEKEWRSRGRWWPDNAYCAALTFGLLNRGE